MESIRTNGFLRAAAIAMMKTHETVPEVWSDDTNREMMRRHFVAHGTNILLDSTDDLNIVVAGAVAAAVQMLGT